MIETSTIIWIISTVVWIITFVVIIYSPKQEVCQVTKTKEAIFMDKKGDSFYITLSQGYASVYHIDANIEVVMSICRLEDYIKTLQLEMV